MQVGTKKRYMRHARESKEKRAHVPGGPVGAGHNNPPKGPSGKPRGRPKKVENKGSDRAQRRNVTH